MKNKDKSIQYKTVLDELIIAFSQTEFSFLLNELEDHELTEIFHQLAEPFKKDFLEFYDRDFEFDVYYDRKNDVIIVDPGNVVSAACLYRSIEDIWTFYDPEEDVYEDGFLRIYYDKDDDKVIVIDYLMTCEESKK